eukprot:172422-Chlamydomonas_euryale.AAC.1
MKGPRAHGTRRGWRSAKLQSGVLVCANARKKVGRERCGLYAQVDGQWCEKSVACTERARGQGTAPVALGQWRLARVWRRQQISGAWSEFDATQARCCKELELWGAGINTRTSLGLSPILLLPPSHTLP